MAIRLYVGNLPYTITKARLEEVFSPFGALTECSVISDKFSGRSKGFGFVEFESDDAARQAIEKLNGTDLDGRNIIVNDVNNWFIHRLSFLSTGILKLKVAPLSVLF